MTKKQTEREEAIGRLREWLKPGDTVFCILRHRSASGMSRTIALVKMVDGDPQFLAFNAAVALGWRFDRQREGVKVGGCGMDMGFHLVYELASVLFPRVAGDADGVSGGYALKSVWL